MDEKRCLNCEEIFIPHRHNMLYCNPACCKIATNKKVIRRYHEKKQKKNSSIRHCSECLTVLSKYNGNDRCYVCMRRVEEEKRKRILRELNPYVG